MKYETQVESIFEKFIQNTVCGKQLNEYQLTTIKNYFQKCWETGFAQGYSDGIKFNEESSKFDIESAYDKGYEEGYAQCYKDLDF